MSKKQSLGFVGLYPGIHAIILFTTVDFITTPKLLKVFYNVESVKLCLRSKCGEPDVRTPTAAVEGGTSESKYIFQVTLLKTFTMNPISYILLT